MVDLYYLGEMFDTFSDYAAAEWQIELLCMSDEGYSHKDFRIRPALRIVK